MSIHLRRADGHVELSGPASLGLLRRPWAAGDREKLADYAKRYAQLVRSGDEAGLLVLGRELYRWLDGERGWLGQLRQSVTSGFDFEVRGPVRPDADAWALLTAPWELLADELGFLVEDVQLGFAPVRRLGEPVPGPALDGHRLGVAFMASAPRGQVELDYEAEERAILEAIDPRHGIDLLVEDSGDPLQLKLRQAELQGLPVLHLSCHGHNAWKPADQPAAKAEPVLLMEDAQGRARPTTAEKLLAELSPYRPRLLAVSACLTAAAGEGDATGGVAHSLATRLVQGGVPAVLGWDGSVADVAATAFAKEFYEELGKVGQTPVAAVASARRLLLAGGPAGGPDKDGQVESRLALRLAAERDALRRDWHLARLWLGPQGGGALVGGARKRTLLQRDHAAKVLLKAREQESEIAAPAMFVGRRRELQACLRDLAAGEHVGVLLHGLGRQGKSSLAARIAGRRSDLTLAVTFKHYDALSVLEDLSEALKEHRPARDLLAKAKVELGQAAPEARPQLLEDTLLDLLADPCAQRPDGRPVLLLVDDLERILEADPQGAPHRVGDAERPVLAALLRAFDPGRSDSRLLLTSRFPFTLREEGGEELALRLVARQLGPLGEPARQKLSRRQVEAAKAGDQQHRPLAEAELAARLPLLEQAQAIARGHPGLHDLLGRKLVLSAAVPAATAAATLGEMEAWLAGGALPAAEELRLFLENLALDRLLELAGKDGRALLQAATLFEVPVPEPVLDALAAGAGGGPGELAALGLLEPFEDLTDHWILAFAVIPLLGGRLEALSAAEAAALAEACLPVLFRAWGGADSSRPYAAALELTRLGLLAGDAVVVAACSGDAVRGLVAGHDNRAAAALGEQALALLDASGQPPSARFLLAMIDALGTVGEVERVDALLAQAEARLAGGSTANTAAADQGDLSSLLLRQGRRLAASGSPEVAEARFKAMSELSRAAGDARGAAIAGGEIADILYARGELDEALRIRREEELPVFERLGDAPLQRRHQGQDRRHPLMPAAISTRLCASAARSSCRSTSASATSARAPSPRARSPTSSQRRGELDEALRIRREEQLPVFERLGDVRESAVTMGKIADILHARGELDEALRIRREEELPVYERLGDVRASARHQGQDRRHPP